MLVQPYTKRHKKPEITARTVDETVNYIFEGF